MKEWILVATAKDCLFIRNTPRNGSIDGIDTWHENNPTTATTLGGNNHNPIIALPIDTIVKGQDGEAADNPIQLASYLAIETTNSVVGSAQTRGYLL